MYKRSRISYPSHLAYSDETCRFTVDNYKVALIKQSHTGRFTIVIDCGDDLIVGCGTHYRKRSRAKMAAYRLITLHQRGATEAFERSREAVLVKG